MNAEYNPAIAKRLIESAHQHEACEAILEFSNRAARFYMAEADKYQRRSRVLTAVCCALGGIALALGVMR